MLDIILSYAMSKYATFEFLPTLKATVAPVLKVIAMTLALYFVNNRAKDSITKALTSVTIAYIPSIVYSIVWLLDHLSSKIYYVLSPIGGVLSVITTVLMYFTVKEYAKEENEENALKKFIKVQAVFYLIKFAVNFLGISI